MATTTTTTSIANRTGGIEVNGQILFGMDAELALKAAAKYDYQLEKDIARWIEAVLAEPLQPQDDFAAALKSGIVLIRCVPACAYLRLYLDDPNGSSLRGLVCAVLLRVLACSIPSNRIRSRLGTLEASR